jgi:hypothetical protein
MGILLAIMMLIIFCAKSFSDGIVIDTRTMMEYPVTTVVDRSFKGLPEPNCLVIIPPDVIVHSFRDCPSWHIRFALKRVFGIEYKQLSEEK